MLSGPRWRTNLNADSEFEQRLSRARAGCPESLGELLLAFHRYLLMRANRELDSTLRPKQAASDVVQETMLAAHRDFQSFRGTSIFELRGWLDQILSHTFSHQVRAYRKAAKRSVEREILFNVTNQDRPGANDSPGEAAIIADERRRVRAALELMPDDYRQVITLRAWQGFSFLDIGRQLGRSAEAAEKLWARAIVRLQQELSRIK